MKTIHKGKVIPDFIVRRETEVGDDGREKVVITLLSDFDYTSRSFLRYCVSERDIEAPALRRFFNLTNMVMNVWWTGSEWNAARFTAEQYMDLVKRARMKDKNPQHGCIAQYGKAKWPTGGGRSAKAAGKFFWANSDVVSDLYRKFLLVDPDTLSAREKVSRTSILFAPAVRFKEPPIVKLLTTSMNGIAWLSPEYALKEGIQRGDKLWPIKASAEIAPFNMQGADMLLPADAVKFEDHKKDTSKLSKLMGHIPTLSAKERSSVEKDRIPKLALDTMQWFHPELKGYLEHDERLHRDLERVQRVIEGKATVEEILEYGKYTDKATGEDRWPMEFEFIRRGQPINEPRIRAAVFSALGTAATKAMCMRVGGQYGVAMPTTSRQTKNRLALCPPWMLPFRVETDIDAPHVCGINSDWMVGCLGKDYDGDLLIILQLDWFRKRLGIKEELFPDWTKKVPCPTTVNINGITVVCGRCEGKGVRYPDQEWSRKWMALPAKDTVVDERSVHDVMVDGLKSYGLIGIATNMCMVVLDTMRIGNVPRKELMGTYLRMMSTEVQQFVDSLKYNPKGMRRPHLDTRTSKRGRKFLGLAEKYGVNEELALKLQMYFKAVRSMDFDALADLPEAPELEGSFYYELSKLFRGWKPVEPINMQKLGKLVAERHQLADSVDRARSRSFVKHRNDAAKRFEDFKHLLDTQTPEAKEEMTIALIARCWARRDTSMALFLEAWWGKRLIDVADQEALNGSWVRIHEPALAVAK